MLGSDTVGGLNTLAADMRCEVVWIAMQGDFFGFISASDVCAADVRTRRAVDCCTMGSILQRHQITFSQVQL